MSAIKPFFSIVIPSLNEEKYLPQLLNDLAKQSFTNFEVIHVDGSSDDKTVEVAQQFSSAFSVKSFVVKIRNVAYQRNFGGKKAKSEWIIFMDADNRIKKDFLTEIFQQLEQLPDTEAFSCFLDIASRNILQKKLVELMNTGMEMSCKIKPLTLGSLIGARREVLTKVQFQENLKMSEDCQFVSDIIASNYKFQFLRKPRYAASMRRFEKDGSLKFIWEHTWSFVVYLSGHRLTKLLPEYEMGGGHYQKKKGKIKVFFPRVQLTIKKASQKQLDQLLSLLSLKN